MEKLPFDTSAYETLSISAFICEAAVNEKNIDDLKIVYANKIFMSNWSSHRSKNFIGALLIEDHIVDEETAQKMNNCFNHPHSINSYLIFANLYVRFEPILLQSEKYIGFLIVHLTNEDPKDERIRFLSNIRQLGNMSILIQQYDDRFEPLYVSPEYAWKMESTVENTLNMISDSNFEKTIHADDRELINFMLTNHYAPDGGENIQIRKITSSGKIIWVNAHYAFIEYLDEKYIYITYFDITTLKENEMRTAALYERTRADLESMANDSLLSLRLNLTKNVVEECRGRELYSMDRVGKEIFANIDERLNYFLIERDRQRFKETFSSQKMIESYKNGKSFISDIFFTQRPDGKKCFVSYTVTLREDPTSGDIIAFAVEKDYNDEIVNNTLLHKALVDQYDMITYITGGEYGVVIGDAERIGKGSIFPKNRRGYYEEYIENEVIPYVDENLQKTVENDLSLEKIRSELEKSDSYVKDIFFRMNGEIFYKRFVFYEVNREADFYILLKADTTAVRREEIARADELRTALNQARQANVAKTAFLSSMSHEIRTPMNAIIGLDHIALKEPHLPPRTKKYLEKIGDSARHLLSLINDILNMSRIESGKMILKNEEFSFMGMLDQINTMINSQCQEKGLTYEFKIKNKLKDFYIGDDTKLKQVLLNILGNAVKFTNRGGKIKFKVEQMTQFEDKSKIKFKISDTGIGMDKEYLPKIFDAFSQEDSAATNSYGGTGLGMAITKNIVEMMNGDISVTSEKNVGTEFVVNVVLKNSERTHGQIKNNLPQNLKVMLIDDDSVALEHATLVLGEVGINAETVMNGEDALKKIKLRNARHEAYDVILIDMKMPIQDGFEVAGEIRKIIGNETILIMLTVYDWYDLKERADSSGIDAFILKPLTASELFEKMNDLISLKKFNKKLKEQSRDLTGRKILLAEDISVNAEIITMILTMKKIEVNHAENGQRVVEMFSKSEINYYDAILMDIRMPIMDGLQATEKIRSLEREDAKKIPIIALTANAFDEDVQRSLQAGMDAHLTKPVEPERLYETLAALIK